MGVDIIFKIAAIGILTAVTGQILKKSDREEMATMTTLAGLIIVLMMIIDMISRLFDSVKSLFSLY
jgi:stage III sporulation protein AC